MNEHVQYGFSEASLCLNPRGSAEQSLPRIAANTRGTGVDRLQVRFAKLVSRLFTRPRSHLDPATPERREETMLRIENQEIAEWLLDNRGRSDLPDRLRHRRY
jgi:hypothetical protein